MKPLNTSLTWEQPGHPPLPPHSPCVSYPPLQVQDFSKAVMIIELKCSYFVINTQHFFCVLSFNFYIFVWVMYFGAKVRMRSFWEVHVLPGSVTTCARDSGNESCCQCCLVSAFRTPTGGVVAAERCTHPKDKLHTHTHTHTTSLNTTPVCTCNMLWLWQALPPLPLPQP